MNPKSPRERGLIWIAAGCLALSATVFVIVYSACNRFTATRNDVGSFYFEWERSLPFVRELVVPYWSLDLFFCGAFFLCRSRAELRLLTSRLVLVVLASGASFLFFPLRFGWERPEPEGWTAFLFRSLYANDLPFNLAPSLHISLRSLVWIVYGKQLRGPLRTGVKLWFIVIGLSTILVWQHHLIDVATGFLMGWVIQAVLPEGSRRRGPATAAHRTIASWCGFACFVFLLPAQFGGGWLWFGWPAVSAGIIFLSYLFRDARLFGKENGTLSPAAEWCVLPWLAGARLVQHRWLKRRPAARQVAPNVLFGRRHTKAEAAALVESGPLAVLDLTALGNAPAVFRERAVYANIPFLDLVTPSPSAVEEAVAFIRSHQPARTVLIQCRLGLQRSATVAAAWLMECGLAPDGTVAAEIIRRVEPCARLSFDATYHQPSPVKNETS